MNKNLISSTFRGALLALLLTSPFAVLADYNWTLQEISIAANQFIYNEIDADGSNVIVAFPTFNTDGGRIFTSSNSGASWTERYPAGATTKNWRAIATDSDGSNLIAGVMNGRLYTSSNGGTSWTERRPAGDSDQSWQSVASDGDGSTLIATTSWGNAYVSTNGGSSWATRQPSGDIADWMISAISDDGAFMAVAGNEGRLYTSSNSGSTWTERQPAGNTPKSWQSIAMDSDGSHLALGVDGGRLYTSSDFGVSWTETQPLGDTDQDWQDLAMSDDGNKIAATVYGGRVYFSSDSGLNWTEIQPAGDTAQYWIAVSMDSNANNIVLTKNQIFSGLPTLHVYRGEIDQVSPLVASTLPANNSYDINPDATLAINFNEPVKTSYGNIVIKKGGRVVETINAGSPQVNGSGTSTITIDPAYDLEYGASYNVSIDGTAFADLSGNKYQGTSKRNEWEFKTLSGKTQKVNRSNKK